MDSPRRYQPKDRRGYRARADVESTSCDLENLSYHTPLPEARAQNLIQLTLGAFGSVILR
jgi:hypothetical protein